MREGKVAGSNPAGHVVREYYAKNVAICDFDGAGGGLGSGVFPK